VIELTRLNGSEFVLNADLIRTVEANPDTLIRLTTGDGILVREAPSEIVLRVRTYRRSLQIAPFAVPQLTEVEG